MAKLLEVRICQEDWAELTYASEHETFSDLCLDTLAVGEFIYNCSEEIFIMEQDFEQFPSSMQEFAIVTLFKNNGPKEGNYA